MDRVLPKIDTYHLLIFYLVCREKSITIAAEKLVLTQPTVTSHIKSLEKSTQVKLIQINRKKLSLTEVGENLYHYAQEIFDQAMAADRYLEVIRGSSLCIGVSPLLVRQVTRIVNNLAGHLDSTIRLEVKLGESFILLKELVDSRIDLAVIPTLAHSYSNLTHVRIAGDIQLVFFASPSHKIFKKSKIGWQDLADYPLVVGTETSCVKKIILEKFASLSLKAPERYYFTSYSRELFPYAVCNGDYISLAVLDDIKDEVANGLLKIVPLQDGINLNIDVVAYNNRLSAPVIQQFISFAKDAFGKKSMKPN